MSATVIAAAQAARRRKLVNHFRAQEATIAERAISEDTLPGATSMALRRFRASEVIRTTPEGKLYLDERRFREAEEARHAWIVKVFAGMAIAAALVLVFLLARG